MEIKNNFNFMMMKHKNKINSKLNKQTLIKMNNVNFKFIFIIILKKILILKI